MTDFITAFLLLFGVLVPCGMILFLGMLAGIFDASEYYVTPRYYYEYEGCNWFGSWILFILKTIFSTPTFVIVKIFQYIYRFFKWLFTVERK